MIEIPDELMRRMKEHAVASYPRECCGLMLGLVHGEVIRVKEIVVAANMAEAGRMDRYEMDPRAIMKADREGRERGLEIVGVYHSHPDHPARPSRTDVELAWEGYAYLILRAGQVQDVSAWSIIGSDVREMPIALMPQDHLQP